MISRFEEDPQTELIVMCGEIGGDEEERTADYIAEHVTKPVVAYIAGFTAPPGKTMGHAGAIISGSSGTAQAKAEALEAKGVRVGREPDRGRRDRGRDPRRRAARPVDLKNGSSRAGRPGNTADRSLSRIPQELQSWRRGPNPTPRCRRSRRQARTAPRWRPPTPRYSRAG